MGFTNWQRDAARTRRRGRLRYGRKRERLAVAGGEWFTRGVALPYKISTLLYCFNGREEVLLLERTREPNRGLWSPCGGKLHMEIGESPYACACREAREEIGLEIAPGDLRLTGIISEHGYEGQSHWLMFLFEVRTRLKSLPPPIDEGVFQFFPRAGLDSLKLPKTDVEQIWPLFWKYRGGFFAAHCHCNADGTNEWTLEEVVGTNTGNFEQEVTESKGRGEQK